MPVDLHMCVRRPQIQLSESFTGKILKAPDFRFRLDKEGRIPFMSETHVVFGDKNMSASMLKPKMRAQLLERAQRERWVTRSPDYVRTAISSATNIPMAIIRAVSFS